MANPNPISNFELMVTLSILLAAVPLAFPAPQAIAQTEENA